ncbi:hypothetical protein DL96DRAFT_1589789 [Flagelloscypha sp. PMI_526]|nr:hypothetical protein DL96DRAFT_1589789 [Flagelloscypha sp. PMI_526]
MQGYNHEQNSRPSTPMPLERASSAAPHRKPHHKSRGGCRNCKNRRVKCDEGRPVCGACLRRKEACNWLNLHEQLSMVLTSAAVACLTDCQLELPPIGEFRRIDLELVHHWTTATLQTFVPDVPVTRHGFQIRLPQLALQNDFLLHSMFALSALHINVLRQSEEHSEVAKVHCQKAILSLDNASDYVSWELAFMANALISIFWLALPQDGSLDLFDWFPAARTFMRRLKTYWVAVSNGIIKDSPIEGLTKRPQNPMLSPFPTIVENIHREDVCPYDPHELMDFNVVRAYELLLQKLSYMWNVLMHPNLQNVAIYLFPAGVHDEFIDLFMKKRPRALILVAHYFALLTQFGSVWWYGADRARNDILKILSFLDSKWLPWMEYPLNVVKIMEGSAGMAVSMKAGPSVGEHTGGNSSSVGSWDSSDIQTPVAQSAYYGAAAEWQSSDLYPPMINTPDVPYPSSLDIPPTNTSKSPEANPSGDVRELNLAMLALSSM